MAVKASATITLSFMVDVKAVYRYYKLQASTASAPSVPTTATPSGWTDTEPTYTEGSTNTLYFVDKTVFTNDEFVYSRVSVSSSYEAAKVAYNKAVNANNTANDAKDAVDNLEIVGRNLAQKSATLDASWWNYNIIASDVLYRGCVSSKTNIAWTGPCLNAKKMYESGLISVGDVLTYSIMAMSNWSATLNFACYRAHSSDGTAAGTSASIRIGNVNMEDGVWQRISATFTVDEYTITRTDIRIECNTFDLNDKYYYGNNRENAIYFSAPKLEKGNKATDWSPAPEDVDASIEEAAKTATNFIDYQDGTGLIVGDMTDDILGKNTLIDANGMAVRDGSSELARFGSNRIELGKNAECSEIKFCNDSGSIVSTDTYIGMGAYRTTEADPSDFCGMLIHDDGTTVFNGETVEVHNASGNKLAINSEGVDIYKGSEKAGHFGSDGLYLNRGIYHRKSDRPGASIGDELPTSNYCFGGRYCYDSNGTAVNFSESWLYNDGTMFSSFVTRRKDSAGDNYNNGLYLYLDPDGSPRVGFATNPAGSCATAWRTALCSKITVRLSEAPSLTTSSTKLMFESILSEQDSGSRISLYNGGLKFSADGYIYLSTTLRAFSVAASAYIQLDIYRGTTNTNCKAYGFNGNSKAYFVTMNSDAVLRVSSGDVLYLYAKTSSGTASMYADAGNRLTAIYI